MTDRQTAELVKLYTVYYFLVLGIFTKKIRCYLKKKPRMSHLFYRITDLHTDKQKENYRVVLLSILYGKVHGKEFFLTLYL